MGKPKVDPLGTDNAGEYSIHQFRTSAGGKDADRAAINVKVPVWMHIRMLKAVNAVSAYDYITDLVRDAIWHRLHYIENEYDVTLDPHTPYSDTLVMVETAAQQLRVREQIVRTTDEAVGLALEVGDVAGAIKLVADLEMRAETMAGTTKMKVLETCADARRRIRQAQERP